MQGSTGLATGSIESLFWQQFDINTSQSQIRFLKTMAASKSPIHFVAEGTEIDMLILANGIEILANNQILITKGVK